MPKSEGLPYIKVHDNITDHPKIELLDDDTAAWLLIATWSYSNRHHLDGQVPAVKVHRMTAGASAARARKLVKVGLLHDGPSTCCETPRAEHYVCHDYLKSQRSAAEIATLRERNALAGRKGGAAKAAAEAEARRQQDAKRSASEVLDGSPSAVPSETASETASTSLTESSSNMSSESLADLDLALDLASNEAGKPLARAARDATPDGFAEFWLAYPRKVGKPAALKAYRKALKATTGDTLVAAAVAYARIRQGEDPKFTPHPSSWLNDDRWDTPAPGTRGSGIDRQGRPCEPGTEHLEAHERFRNVGPQ